MNEEIKRGLSTNEVENRISRGEINYDDSPKTKTVKEIIRDNCLTYFNFLNIALGVLIFIASIINGQFLQGFKNCLFMGVIFVNTIISIVEEIISKKIIDNLSVVSEVHCIAIRDSNEVELTLEEIVKDDILKLSAGHQVVADAIVLKGQLEVNEALITGEADAIPKKEGSELLSGSFITSGTAYARVTHVGKENYVSKISREAKYKKNVNSIVMESFTKMLKVLSIMIIPIGLVMFANQYKVTGIISESIFATVASLIGMIPEGLVLLTSSVMAVGVIKLYRVHVLVQELYAIETLARVDMICLDKTGTLTEGRMEYKDAIPAKKHTKSELEGLLERFAAASEDKNQTMLALKNYFNKEKIDYKKAIPFSSERKYSALEFEEYTLYLGAPNVLFDKNPADINKYSKDYRVLALGKKISGKIDELKSIDCIGYILVEDIVRPSCKETLDYFKENGVGVKIISGDDIETVLGVATKVGLTDLKGIDIGELSNDELYKIIDEYQAFGRVKPEQKRFIIRYLKEKGHTVAMTGDGVNDVLALKESDCAISIKSGADAARNVSQLILLNDDFNSLPRVVEEGRQTINNVERSASLLLTKTIYTMLLIVFSILSSQKYFFIPIQLTFITAFTIGAPSFLLALEPNKSIVKGNFMIKIFSKALPAALTVLFNIVLVSCFSLMFDLSYELESSISVILTTMTGLLFLYKISKPFSKYRAILFGTMLSAFVYCRICFPSFFNVLPIDNVSALIIFVLALDSLFVYRLLNFITTLIFSRMDSTIKVERTI